MLGISWLTVTDFIIATSVWLVAIPSSYLALRRLMRVRRPSLAYMELCVLAIVIVGFPAIYCAMKLILFMLRGGMIELLSVLIMFVASLMFPVVGAVFVPRISSEDLSLRWRGLLTSQVLVPSVIFGVLVSILSANYYAKLGMVDYFAFVGSIFYYMSKCWTEWQVDFGWILLTITFLLLAYVLSRGHRSTAYIATGRTRFVARKKWLGKHQMKRVVIKSRVITLPELMLVAEVLDAVLSGFRFVKLSEVRKGVWLLMDLKDPQFRAPSLKRAIRKSLGNVIRMSYCRMGLPIVWFSPHLSVLCVPFCIYVLLPCAILSLLLLRESIAEYISQSIFALLRSLLFLLWVSAMAIITANLGVFVEGHLYWIRLRSLRELHPDVGTILNALLEYIGERAVREFGAPARLVLTRPRAGARVVERVEVKGRWLCVVEVGTPKHAS